MIITSITGKTYQVKTVSKFHIFVEALYRNGLTPGGVYVERTAPQVEAIVQELPQDRSFIQGYAPELQVGDRVVFFRWSSELLDWNYDWEEIEVVKDYHPSMLLMNPDDLETKKELVFESREVHVIDLRSVEAIIDPTTNLF